MPVIDAVQVDSQTLLQSDICIVGGGAAGIAIAQEFLNTPYQVLLLESGDFVPDPQTQALYDVQTVGHPMRLAQGYVSRNRYFGGSTNTWGGRCMALNPIDFAERDWVADSGWPFDLATLAPFYDRAAQLLGLPTPRQFAPQAWQGQILGRHDLWRDPVLTPTVALYAPSVPKLRQMYGPLLRQAPNLQIYLNANVTELEPNPDLRNIQRLQVQTLSGNQFWVSSRVVILACGGWENARLLLASQRHCPNGLGNGHDLVGRYYMEHPKLVAGRIYPTAKALRSPIFQDLCRTRGGFVQLGLRLTDAQQRQHRMLNHHVELLPGSTIDLAAATQTFKQVGSYLKRGQWGALRNQDIAAFWPHLGEMAHYFIHKRFNRPIPYPHILLRNHLEQSPQRHSRICLSRQRDALGMPRLQVYLAISRQDQDSLVRFHDLLGQRLQALGLGRLESPLLGGDPASQEGAWATLTDSSHHMGTTRMGRHPRQGVVDDQGQLHGCANLFIASSSVFPTGGHANPTLTLLALALRLADHLKTQVLPAQVHRASPRAGLSASHLAKC
ncbi:MAG: GMC oxidoreductase [Spirulina sp.]